MANSPSDSECAFETSSSEGQGRRRGKHELQQAELDRLGRKRPAVFPNAMSEILFCLSMLLSVVMSEYLTSGFSLLVPSIVPALNIPADAKTWTYSIFSLSLGAFLLPFGRLADMYGGYVVFVGGLAWHTAWTVASGFSGSPVTLIVTRALGGLGAAAYLPTGIMLLGKTYRPGPRKNLVFGLYAGLAPLGFCFGIMMGGAVAEHLSWRWWFWIAAILLGLTGAAAAATVPRDYAETRAKGVCMDWWGAVTIVPALLLIVYAMTAGTRAGWTTPHVLVSLVLGVVFLGAAVYVEGWVAQCPLLPFDLFRPKYMGSLTVALFFAYGAFGVFMFYSSFYIETIVGMAPTLTAVWYLPMVVGGLFLASFGGLVLHLVPGKLLLVVSGLGALLAPLLFALMPSPRTSYWAYVFPAMICCTVGIDITYSVSNVFITTNVPQHRQGAAGALINSVLFLGISFLLGVADLAVAESERRGHAEGYKVAFWFATGCQGVALALFCYVRLGKAESQLTVDEAMEGMRVERTDREETRR